MCQPISVPHVTYDVLLHQMFMQLLISMNLNLHNGDGEMLISYKM